MTKIFITSQFCQLVLDISTSDSCWTCGNWRCFWSRDLRVVIFGVVGVVIFGVVGIVVGQIGPPGISAGIYT